MRGVYPEMPELSCAKSPIHRAATCVLPAHEGLAEMLSPRSYGHSGAWGTQAWIDPVKGVAYVLMVQRSNFPNSDASDVRREFQQAAASALAKK